MKGPLIFFDIESRGRDKTWPFPQAAVKKWIKKKKKKEEKKQKDTRLFPALPSAHQEEVVCMIFLKQLQFRLGLCTSYIALASSTLFLTFSRNNSSNSQALKKGESQIRSIYFGSLSIRDFR